MLRMLRRIVSFHQDEESDWVADLSCGHAQHTRHDPPFFPRPWVLTEEGRSVHIGTGLNCVLCDRQEMPKDFVPYRRTSVFNVHTVPHGLRKNHSTKPGGWGVIHVLQGKLRYRIDAPLNTETILDPTLIGIVLPEIKHAVQPFADTEFFVEFWRRQE